MGLLLLLLLLLSRGTNSWNTSSWKQLVEPTRLTWTKNYLVEPTLGTKQHQKRNQLTPKEPKKEPIDPQRNQKRNQLTPKGTKKGTKQHQKRNELTPKEPKKEPIDPQRNQKRNQTTSKKEP